MSLLTELLNTEIFNPKQDKFDAQSIHNKLDKAESDEEVETITFGLETDDGKIIKVYVAVEDADAFEEELANRLGEEDNIEDLLDELSIEYDIVDVDWGDEEEDSDEESDKDTGKESLNDKVKYADFFDEDDVNEENTSLGKAFSKKVLSEKKISEDDYYPEKDEDDSPSGEELQKFIDGFVEEYLGGDIMGGGIHKGGERIIISYLPQYRIGPEKDKSGGNKEEWRESGETLIDALRRAEYGEYEIYSVSRNHVEVERVDRVKESRGSKFTKRIIESEENIIEFTDVLISGIMAGWDNEITRSLKAAEVESENYEGPGGKKLFYIKFSTTTDLSTIRSELGKLDKDYNFDQYASIKINGKPFELGEWHNSNELEEADIDTATSQMDPEFQKFFNSYGTTQYARFGLLVLSSLGIPSETLKLIKAKKPTFVRDIGLVMKELGGAGRQRLAKILEIDLDMSQGKLGESENIEDFEVEDPVENFDIDSDNQETNDMEWDFRLDDGTLTMMAGKFAVEFDQEETDKLIDAFTKSDDISLMDVDGLGPYEFKYNNGYTIETQDNEVYSLNTSDIKKVLAL